ncbi:MAG: hydantoinase B/oxoprolinase family protein [Candidatus Tectomicrobia bacterium]|nr:hydantoinase B/oxoprolinase family protein [Candidatus Tectomicrobia bacterium]
MTQHHGAPEPVDPFTFEIVKHRLHAITEEQGITLKAVSGSPIVTEACDFNTGIYLRDGSIVCIGMQVIMQAGSMALVIRNVIKDCTENPGIEAGDMFILNDPAKGALHPPDVSIVAPVFVEDRCIAWVGTCAHVLDVGGMEFGSWCPTATERVQEAMLIPPLKLVERGRLRNDIWRMILGMTRLPQLVGLDLKAMIAANNVARRRLLEAVAQFGEATVLKVMEGLIAYSESRLRARLRELPDGVFTAVDYQDHDGHANRLYRCHLELRKHDDRLAFDFSGSSPQSSGFINATESCLIGGVCAALFTMLAFDIPWTEGLLRPVEIVAPEGTICKARTPAPVGMATVATGFSVMNASVAAVSRLLSCHPQYRRHARAVSRGAAPVLNLAGVTPEGERFGTLLLDILAGGGGAMLGRDGLNAGASYPIPTPNIANVETNESIAPILYLYRKFIPDTGGAGLYRGGLAAGMALTPHKVPEVMANLVTHGVEVPNAQGLFGGHPGSCVVNTLVEGSDLSEFLARRTWPADVAELGGQHRNLGAKPGRFRLRSGEVFAYTWQGGGGIGDPLLRPAQAVARDVRLGYVGRAAARDLYGVVLSPEHGAALEEETKLLRQALSRERGAVGRAPTSGGGLAEGKGRGDPESACGLLLLLRHDGNSYLACPCAHRFCPPQENWKRLAVRLRLAPNALGPLITLHAGLQAYGFACPACGRLLAIDLLEHDEAWLHEASLTGAVALAPAGMALRP